ncbi:MAG: hypothetical protein JWQ35_2003, partial [Bacteriovoracaceae bacterium]|nr:hypothetical protein [Bacteriovoracaceae bacterium]
MIRFFFTSLLFLIAVDKPLLADLPSFDDFFKTSQLGKVQTKEKGHFAVSWVHPRDEIIVDALLEHLELADKDLDPIFRSAGGVRKKTPIEIYPDLKSFSAVSGLSMARFKATGTIALTLGQRLMILSPRNLAGGYPWGITVVHEYTHYLIREITLDYIPIWLHEGVAQMYQGYPYIKNWDFEPSQWGLFKKAKQKKKWLNLETLKEPFPYRKDPEEAELAYIEALIFVKWLDQQCGAVNLVRFAGELQSTEKALSKCTHLSETELQKKFLNDVLLNAKIPDRTDVQFFARDFSGKDPLETEGRKMDKISKNYAVLSDQEFKQGRFKASAIEMEKAFHSTPVVPPSWSRQLASAYQKSGKPEKARATLETLLHDYPRDAAGWYLLAELGIK